MASLLEPVDDLGRTLDVGSFLDRLRAQQTPTDPIWPVSNPVGTENLVDYRGYDQPMPAPRLPPDALSRALAPAPNTEYGSVLPIARDTTTGDLRLALPSSLREQLQGAYDLSQGPRTGTVTPEGTMSLLAAVDPLARPQEGLLGSLRVNTPAGNIARVDRRSAQDNTLLDATTGLGRTVGEMVDRHIAEGGVDLYGARSPADVMVTLPPTVTSPASIAEQRQKMLDQATAMTVGVPPGAGAPRYWYRDSGEAFHAATGEDLEATRRAAAAHAITSPQTDVQGNANFAVNAWAQSLLGHPIAVASGQKNAALEEALYGTELPSSRKTGPFYENPIRYLDPAMAANIKTNITNDIWAMRQVGFQNRGGTPYSGTPVTGEDNYVRLMYDQAARDLNAAKVDGGGWNPDQVQAALWTYERNAGQTGTPQPIGFNFGDALGNITAAQTQAHRAGAPLLGAASVDPQAQGAFQQAATGLLTDQYGRDIVNHSLGLLTPPGVPGGAYTAVTSDGIKPAGRTLMDASSLIRATLLRQPDAFWLAHPPPIKTEPTIANANVVLSQAANPAEHAPALRAALDAAGLQHAVLQQTPTGVRVINLDQHSGMTNSDFQTGVRSAIRNAGLPADLKRSRTDYGYFSHDWTADPTGSSYIAALSRLPPNLQRVGDQLFAQLGGRIDAAGSQISGRPSQTGPWRIPGFAQAVGPADAPLPLRPWVQRPSPSDPGSSLLSLLGGASP